MLITNGVKTIEASEKAYRVVYKQYGYRPVEESKVQEVKQDEPVKKTRKKKGE